MTNDRTILITGVTGKQGGAVAQAASSNRDSIIAAPPVIVRAPQSVTALAKEAPDFTVTFTEDKQGF
jgi:uncharacterized protein YbjT (DUF2867 family)